MSLQVANLPFGFKRSRWETGTLATNVLLSRKGRTLREHREVPNLAETAESQKRRGTLWAAKNVFLLVLKLIGTCY